ncbi:hypothetical protein [Streptomyces sp. V1I6]|uniref:hypothetical protein n=1 Tax=Streptomyces sp. V1I6 TaxID=3042273 RepID=UPI002786840E|nr:hypothetical protein [Streptomyces sp. V1I6]MDQ0847607.1 hypothetical protein [Streptomyces sp. V1I6]
MARWKKDAAAQQQYRLMSDDELRDALRHFRNGEARAVANKGRRSWKAMRQAIEDELQRRGLLE